jgi:Protein of unknown function (DUF3455)
MSNNLIQLARKSARVRSLFVGALVLGCALGLTTNAAAQKVEYPSTPPAITPPHGNTAFLIANASGSQGYTCLPTSTSGTAWSTNARPEATLFVKFQGAPMQIITHFTSIDARPNDNVPKPVLLSGNATWQSSLDTSKVWAQKVAGIPAGSDRTSCPNQGAIDCLLLQSIGNQEGPTGGRLLAKVTFVQRLNTKGGAAPSTACTVGQTQLVGYSADYVFFRGEE